MVLYYFSRGEYMENKTSAINIQVDSNVKKEATLVLTDLGLSMSSAINLFLKQVVKKNGLPFEVTNVVENKKILDVVCGLIMKDGKCLIARRKKEDHVKGKWEFPGGRRQGLEDEKKSLERAFTELYNIKTNINDYLTHSICEYPGHIVDLKMYQCDYISGNFKLSTHSEYKWVNIEELLDYDLCDADVILSKFLIKRALEESRK
jgi:addiction module RelB/DinJ family antitoxin